ncbi:uncharacterized protein [Drosophila pseudoobscura]|uniref:Prolyl 4-hydroxylase N-terminal domain-containing protein n=1 Tax=Drosophila pseudoobscura pseudoobscura TaxID=46245 RepID=A0A6I8VQG1_DROPS|nr:uncharacterized protein LOC117183366 [Drosophila pseudoobscura]
MKSIGHQQKCKQLAKIFLLTQLLIRSGSWITGRQKASWLALPHNPISQDHVVVDFWLSKREIYPTFKMQIQCCLLSLLLLPLVAAGSLTGAEYSLSVVSMKPLVELETKLIQNLDDYVKALEHKLQILRRGGILRCDWRTRRRNAM